MPHFNSDECINKAVSTLLNQSYKDFELLIVNDKPETLAQDLIKSKDSRIKYFDMAENRGRYFIDTVCSRANPYEFYLPTDSDDYSSRDRLFYLVEKQRKTEADAVFHYQSVVLKSGKQIHETYPLLFQEQTAVLRHLAHFSGLYKTDAILNVGFHPDFRVGYDTLFVNLIRLTSYIAVSPRLLYTRNYRQESLTGSLETGFGSSHRKEAVKDLIQIYKKCFRNPDNIKETIDNSIRPETKEAVDVEVKRLKKEMSWS